MGLVLALIAQLAIWRDLHEEEKRRSSRDLTAIAEKHRQLRTQIDHAKERLQRLENTVLWGQPDPFLPLLGKVAEELPVKLVGVEELTSKLSAGYQSNSLIQWHIKP